MHRSPDTYVAGAQIDPDAEQELREWASSQPCEEPEFAPLPHLPDARLPLHSLDDYSAWQGMPPGEVGIFGG